MRGTTLIGHLKAGNGLVVAADGPACELLGLDPANPAGSDVTFLDFPCLRPGGAELETPCDHRAVRRVGPGASRTVVASCRCDADRPGEARVCDLTVLDASDPADIIHRIILAKHEIEEVFDSSPWLSVVCDAELKVVRANRALARELGLRFGDMIERPAARVLEALGGEAPLRVAEDALKLKNPVSTELRAGHRLFVVEGVPVQRSHDEWLVLLRFQDVTRERALETKLMHWDRLRHLGELAAGIAHEAITPVSYIAWNLERLLQFAKTVAEEGGAPPGDATEAVELASESLEGVAGLKKMLKDLRAFSHPGDKLTERATLTECAERALSLAGAKLREGVTVSRRYPPDPALLVCQPNRLTQVFVNLVANALDAMDGSGTLSIAVGQDDVSAWAEIGDTGSGIEPENLALIFDSFFTTKPSASGTGLGLALSRMIVAAHGGDLTVNSRRGEGSVFRVSIPITNGAG